MPYSLGMHPVPGMLCYHIYILAALLPLHATLAYTASVVAFDMNKEHLAMSARLKDCVPLQNPVKLTDPDIVFRLIIANCYSNHGMPDTVRPLSVPLPPHAAMPCRRYRMASSECRLI